MVQKVRVCPKCKHENPPTNTACEKCKELIFEVPFTDSAASSGASSSRPEGPIDYNPPARAAAKSGGSAAVWVIVLIVIAALGAGGWWFFTRPLPPDQVVQKLNDPAIVNDLEKLKLYLSKSTLALIVAQYGSEEKLAAEMKANPSKRSLLSMAGRGDTKTQTGKVTYEGDSTALVEIIPPKDQVDQLKKYLDIDLKYSIVLLKEDNAWKVDFMQTGARMQTQMMNAMQKKNGGRMPMPSGRGFGGPPRGMMTPPPGAPMAPPSR